MPKTAEDLEGFLNKLERRYERLDDATYLVALDTNQPPIALRVAPPVVVLEVQIGSAPGEDTPEAARLFRRLLELNVQGLMHVAYALEQQTIVLCAARELDTLDLNELQAVLADIGVALAEHVPLLRQMATKGA
jgi:hypothetical protein